MGAIESIHGVFYAIGMAVFYSLVWYASKFQKGEAFDARRLLRIIILGIIVGIASVFMGWPIRQETVQEQLVVLSSYAFLIALIDKLVLIILRALGLAGRI